ncbi:MULTISPECIES: hypothetical protein, partial [unclassified Caballeronia]|uniref:hypothetical protein n=1 Tax=unclassified Caballeronia TaxID=2646786 RepID=UPI0020294236
RDLRERAAELAYRRTRGRYDHYVSHFLSSSNSENLGEIPVRDDIHATRKRVSTNGRLSSIEPGQIDAQRRVRSHVRPTDA